MERRNFREHRQFPWGHLITLAPAFAQIASWALLSPETPIAPMIWLLVMSGTPPPMGIAPGRSRNRSPVPPPATKPSNTLLGRLNRADFRALSIATCALPVWVLSIFS